MCEDMVLFLILCHCELDFRLFVSQNERSDDIRADHVVIFLKQLVI